MEFCQDTLITHINDVFHQGFPERTIVEVFVSVCEAVDFMHNLSPPVVHRDLKPENILHNGSRWKLCDFGSATRRVYSLQESSEVNEANDDIQKNTTSSYRAPEMVDLFRRLPIGTKADVWALGCVLFKLCTFQDAFSDGSPLPILNCRYQWPSNRSVNQKFKDLVKFMFIADPNERPSARDVLSELQRAFPEWVGGKWGGGQDHKRAHKRSSTPEPRPTEVHRQPPPPAPAAVFPG
jgi:AP2-associated kinase